MWFPCARLTVNFFFLSPLFGVDNFFFADVRATDEIVSQFVIKLSNSMPIDYCVNTATLCDQSHTVSTSTLMNSVSPYPMASSIVAAVGLAPSLSTSTTTMTTTSALASASSYSSLLTTTTDSKYFPCDTCGNVYSYKTSLARHVRFECGKAPQFKCPFCEHRTKHKSSLTTHIDCKHRQELMGDDNRYWRELYALTKTQ